MRSKYKKKRSVEQQKKQNQSIEQNLNDLSTSNHLKILSPEIKPKNNLVLNINDTEIPNDKKNINKQNDILKNNKRKNYSSLLIKDNNNNIQTVSNELKNSKINNNENYIKKNNNKKYMLILNKISKINNYNRNIRINKEKDISINNNKNIIKNKSQKNINENEDKINSITNSTIANSISKRRIYEPLNQKYLKDNNKNSLNIDIIPIKTIIDLNEEKSNKSNKFNVEDNNNLKSENSKNNIKEKNSSVSADTKASTYSKESLKYLIDQAHLIKELTPLINNNNIQESKKIQYKLNTYDPNGENNFLNKNIYDKIYNNSINNNNPIIYNKNMVNLNILKTETLFEKDQNRYDKNYMNKLIKNNNELSLNYNIVNLEENKNKKRVKNRSTDEIIKNKNNEENNINRIELKENDENNRILVHKKNINIGKSLSEKKYNLIDSKNKNWSFLNIIPNNLLFNNNNFDNNSKKFNLKNNNKYSATFIDTIPNKNEFNEIEIEEFYNLELKYKNILIKLKTFQKCPNEYLDWITYYFNYKFYYKIIQIFKSKNNKYTISDYLKIEILSIFLGYNGFFHQNYNQISSYLISLYNLLNNNFLYILIYVINNYNLNTKMTNNIFLNNILINKINQLILDEKKLKINQNKIQNEFSLISLIMDNYKEINNYYKYIVEQIYLSTYNIILKDTKFINNIKYNLNNKNIFPICLKIDKNTIIYNQLTGLISLFFYDSLKILNNYKFEDLFIFFEKYILISEDVHIFNYYKNNNILNNNLNSQIKYRDFSTITNKNPNQYFLPPIKKGYKYTLVLDLDETLVFCRKDNNKNNIKIYNNINNNTFINSKTLIMRPGLLEFLHNMKEIYELVLFSLGTSDYVNSIVKIIEKKETFFDYILYRQHATYNDNYYIKDLSLLGRDLKKIIIVDDLPKSFKLHKKNGICIKPFYGDVVAERNTLKILGNILYKIRFDAEESGDIRKSLKMHKNLIFKYITTNFECS